MIATPAEPYWLAGAWICWSAYAGLNVCVPNLMLKLAGRDQVAAYVAPYFAITSVFYAVSTIAGGYAFDLLSAPEKSSSLARWGLNAYSGAFWIGLIARLVAMLLVARLIEPGARRLRELLPSQW